MSRTDDMGLASSKAWFWQDLKSRFTSCSLWLCLLGISIILVLELTSDQITAITALIVAFTAGEAVVDYAKNK